MSDTQSENKTSKITLPDLDKTAMGALEDEDTIAGVLKDRERTLREIARYSILSADQIFTLDTQAEESRQHATVAKTVVVVVFLVCITTLLLSL